VRHALQYDSASGAAHAWIGRAALFGNLVKQGYKGKTQVTWPQLLRSAPHGLAASSKPPVRVARDPRRAAAARRSGRRRRSRRSCSTRPRARARRWRPRRPPRSCARSPSAPVRPRSRPGTRLRACAGPGCHASKPCAGLNLTPPVAPPPALTARAGTRCRRPRAAGGAGAAATLRAGRAAAQLCGAAGRVAGAGGRAARLGQREPRLPAGAPARLSAPLRRCMSAVKRRQLG
jgi:hypothetical protein